MQAVKLRPEEAPGGPVRSDWLLLWRLLPRGLPSRGEAGGKQRSQVGQNHWLIYDEGGLDSPMDMHDGENPSITDAQLAFSHDGTFCRPLLGSVFGTCCPGGVEDAG